MLDIISIVKHIGVGHDITIRSKTKQQKHYNAMPNNMIQYSKYT